MEEEEEEEFSLFLSGGLLLVVGGNLPRFSISSSCCPQNYNTSPAPTGLPEPS